MDHQLELGDAPGYLLLFTHDGEPEAKLSTIPVPKLTSTGHSNADWVGQD